MMQLLWKTVWQFLKWLNTELSHDSAIPPLGMYPRELKTYVRTKPVHEFHSSIIIAQSGNNINVY